MKKRLVILGGGESGVGTALLGKKEGFEVFLSDFGNIRETYKQVLIHNEIDWEDGSHSEEKILRADLVMKKSRDSRFGNDRVKVEGKRCSCNF